MESKTAWIPVAHTTNNNVFYLFLPTTAQCTVSCFENIPEIFMSFFFLNCEPFFSSIKFQPEEREKIKSKIHGAEIQWPISINVNVCSAKSVVDGRIWQIRLFTVRQLFCSLSRSLSVVSIMASSVIPFVSSVLISWSSVNAHKLNWHINCHPTQQTRKPCRRLKTAQYGIMEKH